MKTIFKQEIVILHKCKKGNLDEVMTRFPEKLVNGSKTIWNLYQTIGNFDKEETIVISDTGIYECDENGNPVQKADEEKIKTFFENLRDKLDETKKKVDDAMKEIIKNKIKEESKKVVEEVKEETTKTFEDVKETFTEKIDEIKNSEEFQKISIKVKEKFSLLKNKFNDIFQSKE